MMTKDPNGYIAIETKPDKRYINFACIWDFNYLLFIEWSSQTIFPTKLSISIVRLMSYAASYWFEQYLFAFMSAFVHVTLALSINVDFICSSSVIIRFICFWGIFKTLNFDFVYSLLMGTKTISMCSPGNWSIVHYMIVTKSSHYFIRTLI